MAQAAGQASATAAAPAASAAPAAHMEPGPAAEELMKIDRVVGTGKEATVGSTVYVNYTGWLYKPLAKNQHGKQFDSSVGRGPFDFPLGAGRVIKGWDQGVAGMKVGGRRRIVIPPHLGYGKAGAGGVIKGGETLVFVVDLLGVG